MKTNIHEDDVSITVSTDIDVSDVVSSEEIISKAIKASHIKQAEDLISGKQDLSLDSKIAVLKTRQGQSKINGPIPHSFVKQFLSESDEHFVKQSDEIEWIVPSLFFRGQQAMVCGDPGAGKTGVLLSMLQDMASGSAILDNTYMPVRPLHILYLNCDSSKPVFESVYGKKLLSPNNNLVIRHYHQINDMMMEKFGIILSFSNPNTYTILQEMIKLYTSDVLVIDTMGPIFAGVNENSAAEMIPIMSKLRSFAAENNILLILVHHFRKRDSKEKGGKRTLEDVGGSRAVYGQCDSVWGIEKLYDDTGKEVYRSGIISVLKDGSSGGWKPFPELNFAIVNDSNDRYHIEFKNLDEDVDDYLDDIKMEILKLLSSSSSMVHFRDIFTAVQIFPHSSKSTIKRSVVSMIDNGYISAKGHTTRRSYTITPLGRDTLTKIVSETLTGLINVSDEDEFSLKRRTDDDIKNEIEKLHDEMQEISSWDISNNRSIDDIYSDAPEYLREKIDEYRSIDEFGDDSEARADFEYICDRISRLKTEEDINRQIMLICADAANRSRMDAELIGRKKLNMRRN